MNKQLRLLKKKDFDLVFKAKSKVASKDFIIYRKPNNLGHARIGISISKKSFRLAVDRNLIKRQVRSMCQNANVFDSNYDIILIIKPQYKSKQFDLNNQELCYLFSKILTKGAKVCHMKTQ